MKKITLLLAAGFFSMASIAQSPEVQSLLDRAANVGDYAESFSSLFTDQEMSLLNDYYGELEASTFPSQNRAPGVFGYGWESQGNGYGSTELDIPANFAMLSTGSGSADFEGAGATNPSDPTTAIVADNVGEVWELDVLSGVYTSLGNVGLVDITGLHYNADGSTLYATTPTELYTVDVSGLSTTLVGATGLQIAIALAIDGDNRAYTYDIADDVFYSVNIADGTSTALGSIGFDANFGQGMAYDPNTDTIYMAAFNAGAGNLSELRTVDTSTGATTLVGETFPGALTQLAWFAIPAGQLSVDSVNASNLISVFPNPAQNFITVSSERAMEIESVSMFNILGQRSNVTVNNNTIDVSGLAGGIYLLQVALENGEIGTYKVMKN